MHIPMVRSELTSLYKQRLEPIHSVNSASPSTSTVSPTELSPSSLHAPLKFTVADNEDILLLAADELDALVDAGVEFVEAGDLVA